jgi:hypothetical protein
LSYSLKNFNTLSFNGTYVIIFSLIIITNTLKPWIDFYTPINYQTITLAQFICLTAFLTLLNNNFYKNIDLISFLFLFFILIKLLTELFLNIFEGNLVGIISPIYVTLRAFLMVYMFKIVLSNQRSKYFFEKSLLILIIYFLITIIYSILQNPLTFGNTIVSEYGGNSTSGNGFGFFRSNGGIGGTVVDYANFLLAVGWVLFFAYFKNSNVRKVLLILFLISVVMCFSRSLFLCIFFIASVFLINFSNIKRSLLSIFLIASFIFLLAINFITLVQGYETGFGNSDVYRIISWLKLFENFTFIEYISGRELGGNTGLFLTDQKYKISGDGYITGFIYDAGLIGLGLTLLVIINGVLKINATLRVKFSILGSLILMLAINSGFEKLFIIFIYILSIGIIHGTNNQSYQTDHKNA